MNNTIKNEWKKIKFSPLLICSIIALIAIIVVIITGYGNNLIGLVVMILLGIGLICLFIHIILRRIFFTNLRRQVIIELILIVLAVGFYYW